MYTYICKHTRINNIDHTERTYHPPAECPITMTFSSLPGFGNDEIDYSNPLNQGDEYGFCTALNRRGFENISVMPLQRYEWIRVAGGLFDIPNFYTGNCKPEGRGYGWYLKRLRSTIEKAYQNAGSEEKVIVIGHSAGGW